MNNPYKKIIIPGIPDVKQRPRFSRKTGHAYDPNAEAKEASIQKAKLVEGVDGIFVGALSVGYAFVFPRPKKHYRTGKNAHLLRDDAPLYCADISKDLDNLEKFYADSFNAIHYRDDRQIVEHRFSLKRWAAPFEEPHVEMLIYALEPEKEK